MNQPSDYELISASLDGELTAEEQQHVDALLASDPAARALHDELRALSGTLQSMPRQELKQDLGETILRRAERAMLSSGSKGTPSTGTTSTGAPANNPLRPDEPATIAHNGYPSSRTSDSNHRDLRMIVWPLLAVAAAVLVMVAPWNPAGEEPDQIAQQDRAPRSAATPSDATVGSGQPGNKQSEQVASKGVQEQAFSTGQSIARRSRQALPGDDAKLKSSAQVSADKRSVDKQYANAKPTRGNSDHDTPAPAEEAAARPFANSAPPSDGVILDRTKRFGGEAREHTRKRLAAEFVDPSLLVVHVEVADYRAAQESFNDLLASNGIQWREDLKAAKLLAQPGATDAARPTAEDKQKLPPAAPATVADNAQPSTPATGDRPTESEQRALADGTLADTERDGDSLGGGKLAGDERNDSVELQIAADPALAKSNHRDRLRRQASGREAMPADAVLVTARAGQVEATLAGLARQETAFLRFSVDHAQPGQQAQRGPAAEQRPESQIAPAADAPADLPLVNQAAPAVEANQPPQSNVESPDQSGADRHKGNSLEVPAASGQKKEAAENQAGGFTRSGQNTQQTPQTSETAAVGTPGTARRIGLDALYAYRQTQQSQPAQGKNQNRLEKLDKTPSDDAVFDRPRPAGKDRPTATDAEQNAGGDRDVGAAGLPVEELASSKDADVRRQSSTEHRKQDSAETKHGEPAAARVTNGLAEAGQRRQTAKQQPVGEVRVLFLFHVVPGAASAAGESSAENETADPVPASTSPE